MKKVVQAMTLVTLLLIACWPACDQGVPGAINYQGKLTDSLGQPAPGPQVLTFKLYEISSAAQRSGAGRTTPSRAMVFE